MHERISRLRDNIRRVYLGDSKSVDHLIRCVLARGHMLIEDVPGVGKTVLATALARSIDCSFSRIQLTPDMLPSDVLGVSVYDRNPATGAGAFTFKPGPIFAQVVLADEINRTPPRTQAALLEAMGEGTVTTEGKTIALPTPFLLIATQNPAEFEGTYPLPENQLDRFLMRIALGYPDPADERRILDLRPSGVRLHELQPVLSATELIELQSRVDGVKLAPALADYIVAIAGASRRSGALALGLSPRGGLALAQVARATALMDGRDYVIPPDITDNLGVVVPHRVIARGAVGAASAAVEDALAEILRQVPAPA